MPSEDEPARDRAKNADGFLFIRLFFGLFLLVGLTCFWAITLHPLWRGLRALSWEATPCTILESEVASQPGDDKRLYRVKILYRYEYGGVAYTSTRFNFDTGASSTRQWKMEVVAELRPDHQTQCFVNPRNPEEAVLERAPRAEIWFGLFTLPFIAVGCLAFVRFDNVRYVPSGGKAAKRSEWRKRSGDEEAATDD